MFVAAKSSVAARSARCIITLACTQKSQTVCVKGLTCIHPAFVCHSKSTTRHTSCAFLPHESKQHLSNVAASALHSCFVSQLQHAPAAVAAKKERKKKSTLLSVRSLCTQKEPETCSCKDSSTRFVAECVLAAEALLGVFACYPIDHPIPSGTLHRCFLKVSKQCF